MLLRQLTLCDRVEIDSHGTHVGEERIRLRLESAREPSGDSSHFVPIRLNRGLLRL